MKKLISLLLSALMVIGLLCGCRGLDTQSDGPEGAEGTSSQNTQTKETVPCHPDTLLDLIPQAVQEQMKADALAQFKPEGEPEVRFEVYGVFGDVYVLFVEYGSGVLDMVCRETVDGIEIWYGSSMTMRVYYNGHYYKLQEAFDAQIIDHFELESAVENYYCFYPFMDPDGEYYLEYLDSLRKSFVENMLQEQYDQPIFWYTSYEEYVKDPQGQPVVYLGEVEGYYVYAVYSPEKPAEAGLTIGSFTFASPVECEIFVFDHAKGLWVLSEAFYSQEVTEEFIGKVHAIWPTEPQPESYWPETPENPSPDLLALTELFGAWGTLYNSALTSTYESPAFINLCFFLEGVSKDHAAQLTPEEQAAFADYGIENMEVFRYTREEVDGYLQQYFGITSADLDATAVRSLFYLESTDCYYIFTNGWDGHVRGVNVIAAETQDDGTILMYYTTGGMPAERLIARIQPIDSGYIILSNQTP